jgi:hypothetical protein
LLTAPVQCNHFLARTGRRAAASLGAGCPSLYQTGWRRPLFITPLLQTRQQIKG